MQQRNSSSRIESMDQFRGYVVAGMVLVNFIGDFPASPLVLGHHDTLATPPFVPPPATRPLSYWVMSKRATTLPYLLFGSGFALTLFAGFVRVVDGAQKQLAPLALVGRAALLTYVVHEVLLLGIKPL